MFSSVSISPIITDIISRLQSRQLLNPQDFINSFVNKNKSKSVAEIKFLLRQKGIDTKDLTNFQFKNDLDAIKTILAKKNLTPDILTDFKQKQRLYTSFFRRGFQLSDINTAIDDFLSLK